MVISKHTQLEVLKEKVAELDLLLKKSATNLVFGKGNPEAEIFFIGEAPGNKEDLQGVPFVGSAGKNLDKLLNLIGLSLDEIYIANILKYRPPDNRNPSKEEIIDHTPYLIEQIRIIQPKVIVTLGNFATKFILSGFDVEKMDEIEGISKLHGQVKRIKVSDEDFTVIPLYHPAAAIYNRSLQKILETDFHIINEVRKRN